MTLDRWLILKMIAAVRKNESEDLKHLRQLRDLVFLINRNNLGDLEQLPQILSE